MRLLTALLTAAALGLIPASLLASSPAPGAFQASQPAGSAVDQQIHSYLQKKMSSNKDLSGVQTSVQDQIVTLTGTVPSYRAEMEAEHIARQAPDANGFVDRMQMNGATVSDQQLQKQLNDRLLYDRIDEGQTFNSLTLGVHDGVVTVGGSVRDYPDRDSALSIIDDTKGVRGVTDNIKVEPLSPMDDQIRIEAAQKIYGNPNMQRYALDPSRPIRIVVDNGHVTLEGVVDSNLDKQLAGNAVNTIPGVFSVKNDLVVNPGK